MKYLLPIALLLIPSLSFGATSKTIPIQYGTCALLTPNAVGDFCSDTSGISENLHVATGTAQGAWGTVRLEGVEPFIHLHISTNSPVATVLAANTFSDIAGTYASHDAHQFTVSGGSVTYTDAEPHTIAVECSISFAKESGGSTTVYFRTVHNDHEEADRAFAMQSASTVASTAIENISLIGSFDVVQNDTLAIHVSTVDGDDITVHTLSCIFEVQ